MCADVRPMVMLAPDVVTKCHQLAPRFLPGPEKCRQRSERGRSRERSRAFQRQRGHRDSMGTGTGGGTGAEAGAGTGACVDAEAFAAHENRMETA